jgi:uncharacterized membrane protein (UPF0127 family)
VVFSFFIYYETANIVKQDDIQGKNIDVSNNNSNENIISNNKLKNNYVIINNYTVNVELALTNEERQKGLMGRENLNDDEGMLFVFEEEKEHDFWMKNMIISLDMIWIDSDGKVVHIEKQVPPCEENCIIYSSSIPAKYVLELNSGSAKRLSIENGIEIQLFIKN